MKTIRLIKFAAVIAYGLFVATFLSCAPKAYPPGPNPLDEPGYTPPTVAELHLENLRAITNNPGYQAR